TSEASAPRPSGSDPGGLSRFSPPTSAHPNYSARHTRPTHPTDPEGHDMLAITIDERRDDVDDVADISPEPVPVAPKARCAHGHGTLTHLFFSDEPLGIARAKAICQRCALRATCLDEAIARAEPWGVWGGELLENGRIVQNKR